MIRLVSKAAIQTHSIMGYKGISKIMRVALMHDGSMTVMVQCMSQQPIKVQRLQQQEIDIAKASQHTLANSLVVKGQKVLMRETIIGCQSQPQCLYARSYWNMEAYDKIMGSSPQIAIGVNLIRQEVEQFKQVTWLGRASIRVKEEERQTWARQYTIKSKGEVLCQIQQFFTSRFEALMT